MKKIVKWFFGSVNRGKGAEMIEGRSYKINTKDGNFWGRFVERLSKQAIVLLGRDGKRRTVDLNQNTSIFKIRGREKK